MSSTPSEVRVYRAPGRVNIIGEHIDYLGGTVLPFACDLELRVTVEAAASEVDFRSAQGDVSRYAECVAQALRIHGYEVYPCRGEVTSDIPVGAGLSSSAALEAGLALALTHGAHVAPAVLQEADSWQLACPAA